MSWTPDTICNEWGGTTVAACIKKYNVEEFLEKYDACIQKKWANLKFGDEVLFKERSGVYLGAHRDDDAYLVYFKGESTPVYIDKHQLRITGMHFEPFKEE